MLVRESKSLLGRLAEYGASPDGGKVHRLSGGLGFLTFFRDKQVVLPNKAAEEWTDGPWPDRTTPPCRSIGRRRRHTWRGVYDA